MALTPAQQKTIRLAQKIFENMLTEMAPELKEYVENQRELASLMAPRSRQTAPQPEPQEDPVEQQRLNELLAEVANKETK